MENIRIQDDLYMHVNQEALDKLVIPDDKPSAGGFAELADGVEKIMMRVCRNERKQKLPQRIS